MDSTLWSPVPVSVSRPRLSIPLNGFISTHSSTLSQSLGLFLSIPLNGFIKKAFWGYILRFKQLSIPLNGFILQCPLWTAMAASNALNSIERILHHHGLCTLWKPAHLHYLDSIPLTPRLGVSCILWSPEFICLSVSSSWFFPCAYMGISIATVSLLVYGWGVQG